MNTQIPALESGDHLTRAEFERRFTAMPNLKKAELVEGIVYITPRVTATHGEKHAEMIGWLGTYTATTFGVDASDAVSTRLDWNNEFQPDALLRLRKNGCSRISQDGFVEGASELVAEVALSDASIDLHAKKNIYRRNGVQEYLVWQIRDERVDWFELRDEEYKLIAPGENGILHSRVFPGLWLAADAMLDGDLKQVLDVLQRGLGSEEHREFVDKMTAMHQEETSG